MKAPDKIFVGITNGKDYSIVGENYPYAKEYFSKEAVIRLLTFLRRRKNVYSELDRVINDFKAMTNAED